MPHQGRGQFEPSHVCLTQSVVLSRRRHSAYGLSLAVHRVASTFLRPFAPRALPRFVARMDALTPGRPALRILIRDNEHRPCTHPGLLVSCIEPSDRSASNHLMPPAGFGLVFPRSLPRGLSTASLSGTTASLGLRLHLAGSPRHPAESSSSSCGPVVYLLLLSTPSREDAVTFGYEVQTQLRQGLSPCCFDTLTSALDAASCRILGKSDKMPHLLRAFMNNPG